MNSLVLDREVFARAVEVTAERIVVELDDGRAISAPLAWFPRLMHATPAERQHWELWGSGYAIEWPDVDEHISVEGLLAGRRSGESQASLDRWLATRKS
jgi:hypothetical protein